MSEQVGVASLERTQPFPDRFGVAPEPFVFANRPPHDESINRAEFGAKFRGIEPTIVTYPSTEDRTHPVAISCSSKSLRRCNRQRRTLCRILLAALLAHRRKKANEAPAVAVSRRSRPKRIAEKVEAAFRDRFRDDLHHCNKRPWSFAGAVAVGTPQTSVPAPGVISAPEPRSDSGR